MKRITAKIIASFVLIFSVVFAGLSIANLTSNPAYALPDSPETPSDITDPSDPTLPNENPDEEPNPDQTPGDTTDPTDPNNPEDDNSTEDDAQSEDETESTGSVCTSQAGSLSWIVCPTTQLIGNVVDAVYGMIGDFLVVSPISTDSNSPIYIVWQYIRNLTNIIFIIFLFIVILSQFTSVGISNYGVKRILPRLIIAVILMNLSFLICALLVDVSNIAGSSLRGFFDTLQTNMLASVESQIEGGELSALTIVNIVTTILAGGGLAGFVIGATGGIGALLWTLVIFLLGGIVAVITGLITIAGRQAVIALLIMIAPLAFATYLLPNTERWFTSWKNLLARMLIFFPAFSFLYGASKLVGWAIIASSTNGFGVVLGLAVQIFPLFFSWSLMKMSGTVLGSLNNALRKVAAPLQGVGTRWAGEHAEQKRQNYIAHNHASSGARLRRYLDYRRKLRLEDTKNAATSREDQATERAMKKMSSIIGRDEEGNTVWEVTPNRYTRTAKSASYHHTLATNATMAYQNTLSGYGRHFKDVRSARLSASTGHAYEETMAQQFLAANEAEADQRDLLDSYLKAYNNRDRNPYQYNRLIRDAAGGLSYLGEASIMGQVIVGNSTIENRRRSEARIMMTKFGVDKTKFRAMVYNKASISDNGRETNEDGVEIEDTEYQLITHDANGNPTGYQRRKWPHYIVVDKKTGEQIDKDRYLAMDAEAQKAYKEVRYYDILNDDKDPVQRVFFDDAGFMKELLRDDIAIGDPINRRYLTAAGVNEYDTSKTGELRKYHSTIAAAMIESRYKEHAAGVTPMVTAQVDRGFINSKGQYNIAELQSITVASKSGSLVQNDGKNIDQLTAFMTAMQDEAAFAKYFPDADIMAYRNVNGVHLDGLRLATDANGNQYWEEINHNNPDITLEDRKNLIRHKILPKAAAKLVGSLNRNISQGALDNMKPDGLNALINMLDTLAGLSIKNAATEEFSDRFNGDMDIFDSNDPRVLKRIILDTQDKLRVLASASDDGSSPNDSQPSGDNNTGPRSGGSGGPSTSSGGSGRGSGNPDSSYPHRKGYKRIRDRQERHNNDRHQYILRNSRDVIDEAMSGIFDYAIDYESAAQKVLQLFNETECLQPFIRECTDAIDNNRFGDRALSTESAIYDSVHASELEAEHIEDLRQAIEDIIDQADTF